VVVIVDVVDDCVAGMEELDQPVGVEAIEDSVDPPPGVEEGDDWMPDDDV
jgi:hypothetical protein